MKARKIASVIGCRLRRFYCTRMQAIHFNGNELHAVSRRRPRPRRGEAVVRVNLAGICSTDLEIAKGYMEFTGIPGHEFIGTVVSSPVERLVGSRVVGEINVPCGTCSLCRRGLEKHCASRSVLGISGRDGAFAEYLTLPAANLHEVPPEVSDEEAVFTEPLAAACEIPERAGIDSGSTVAVLGDGRLAAQVLAMKARNVTVFGISAAKLAVIRKFGVCSRDASETARFVKRFDVVVECTGSPEGLPAAVELVTPRGTIVLKSTCAGKLAWNTAGIVIDEVTIVGSRCGPFDAALRLLERKEVKVRKLLTAVYTFEKWREAFKHARRRESFKVCIRMS